ncbi:MAG: L-lactate dehydrogenase [Gemmatimonadales bacterium]
MSSRPSPMLNDGGHAKIAVVGVGYVGATTAYTLLLRGLASELVLVDVESARAEGEALDLSHAAPLVHPVRIRTGGLEDCAGARFTIIAAGVAQAPGESRLDLLQRNTSVLRDLVPRIARANPSGILVVATNPVDVLSFVALQLSGLPASRVIGSGTIVDTARFRHRLAQHYEVDPRSVHALIIGEHGDSAVPVWSLANIAGMRLEQFCVANGFEYDPQAMEGIFLDARNAAYDIITRKGATAYAVAAGIARIVEAVLRDERSVLAVSTLVPAGHGLPRVYLSLPCVIGGDGVERVLRLELSTEEMDGLRHSAAVLESSIAALGLELPE